MLFGADGEQAHGVAFVHGRQHMVRVIDLGIIGTFLVHGDVAGLDEGRAIGAQQMARGAVGPGQQVHGNGVRRSHGSSGRQTARRQIREYSLN